MNRTLSPIYTRLMPFIVGTYGTVAALDIYPLLGGRSLGSVYGLVLIGVALVGHQWKTAQAPPSFGHFYVGGSAFALLVVALASGLWAPVSAPFLGPLISLAHAVVVFLCLLSIVPRHTLSLIRGFSVGALLVALLLLVQGTKNEHGRVAYGEVDENVTAYVMVVGGACLLAGSTKKPHLPTAIAGVVFLFSMTIMTGSRSGVLAFAITMACTLIFRLPRSNIFTAAFLLLAAAFSFSALRNWALDWAGTPERMRPLLEGNRELDDSNRSAINSVYLQHFNDWWAHGVGYGASNHFIQGIVPGFAISSHNTILKLWIETGVLGLTCVVLLLSGAFAVTIRNRGTAISLPILLPTLLFCLTLGGLESVSAFWFTLAIASHGGHPQEEQQRERSSRFPRGTLAMRQAHDTSAGTGRGLDPRRSS